MQLTKDSEEVTTYTNTTGEMDEIFVAKTPDKKNFRLEDGVLLVMDLRDSSGNKVEGSAKVQIAGQKPTQRFPREIDEKPYRPYNQVSVDNQYNRDNQGELKIEIDPGHIDFIEGHQIKILLESSTAVDWTQDDTILEFEVEEQPYREPRSQ